MEQQVTIFSDPRTIDTLIRNKFATKPSSDPKAPKSSSKKTVWTKDEIELIDGVILSYITEDGLSREKTAQQISDRWGMSMSTARRYVKDAIDRFYERYKEDDLARKIKVWHERVEEILKQAIEDHNKDAAVRALDMLAKSYGAYQTKQDITFNGGDTPIKFDFGE